jgi:tetratricopeptide (TPR) repeat protein
MKRDSQRLKATIAEHRKFVKLYGPQHDSSLQALETLANECLHVEMYEEAFARYSELCSLREAAHGPHHEKTLTAMDQLGNILSLLGRGPQALEVYNAMQQSVTTHHPHNEPLQANILRGFYYLYEKDSEEWRGTIWALHPLVTNEDLFPEQLHIVREVLLQVAEYYDEKGEAEPAIRAYEQALPLLETYDGPHHENTLKALRWLCVLYSSRGQHLKALKIVRTLSERTQSFAGERIVYYFDAQIQYAFIQHEMGQFVTEVETWITLLRDPRMHQPYAQKFKEHIFAHYLIIYEQYQKYLELHTLLEPLDEQAKQALFQADETVRHFQQKYHWLARVELPAPETLADEVNQNG